jgi:hypothetical protein
MPAGDRLARLLEILSGDLSQERLEWLAKEFETLAQDRVTHLGVFLSCKVSVSACGGSR